MASSAALKEVERPNAKYRVAHDLSRFDPRPRVRDAVREMPAPQTAAAGRVRTKAKAVPRTYSMHVSPVAVLSFLAAATLMLMIVFSSMQVSVVNQTNNQLAKELTRLQTEEKHLRRQLEGITDLGEIESYAMQELGMVKPDRESIVYVNLAAEDYGVVYEEESFGTSLKTALSDMWASLCDFFA